MVEVPTVELGRDLPGGAPLGSIRSSTLQQRGDHDGDRTEDDDGGEHGEHPLIVARRTRGQEAAGRVRTPMGSGAPSDVEIPFPSVDTTVRLTTTGAVPVTT